jgi:hypothetical protein
VKLHPLPLAALTCALTLLLAEAVARVTLRNLDFGDSYVDARNPNFRRGLLEYTRPRERPENARLLIVISNSQGFLRERSEGEWAYSKRLEAHLGLLDPQHEYIVANWSIPGGSGPEMTLLAARAAAHRPDGIILVSFGNNFTSPHLYKPLSYGISDADLLAYTPEVRELLPEWFIQKFEVHDTAKWIESRLALLRCRNILSEPSDDAWAWEPREPALDFGSMALQTAGQWRKDSDLLLTCFADVALRGSPDSALIIVNMPVNESVWTEQARQVNRDFASRARKLLGDRPRVTVLNANRAIPTDAKHFYNQDHLRRDGHEAFAQWLAPRLLKSLEDQAP